MAEKFLRMLRTQSGDAGTFHAGRIYRETPATAKALAAYEKRGFAEKTTKKAFEAWAEQFAIPARRRPIPSSRSSLSSRSRNKPQCSSS